MTPNQVLCLAAIVFFLLGSAFIYWLERVKPDDAIQIPVHVPIDEANGYTAQEVFDWAVYVTRATGLAYLEQLSFSVGSRHAFLLNALRTVQHIQIEEVRLERFREIGRSFSLDTEIVDRPL